MPSDLLPPTGPLRPGVPDERLDAWLDDALAPAEARHVAHLVATDAAWAAEAALARRLRMALGAQALTPAPPDFAARLRATLAAEAAPDAVAHDASGAGTAHAADRPARPPRPSARSPRRFHVPALLALLSFAAVVWATRPAALGPPAPSATEVERARREVEWTLATLSRIGQRTAEQVGETALDAPADGPPSDPSRTNDR